MRSPASAILTVVFLLLAPAAQGAAAQRSSGHGLHVAALSCITANTHVASRRGCATVPGAGYESTERSGLDGVTALAAAGGGTSLYAVGNQTSALTQLGLGPPSRLSFAACFSGDTVVRTCAALPGATANAPEAPLSYPTAAAISPDGRSLYVTSGDFHGSVVARFVRDPATGALTYAGCLTGDLGAVPAGCAALPSATREGYGSGLYEPSGIAVSADGAHVYVTAAGDGSVAAFDRDPVSGALSFVGCVSGYRRAVGCARIHDSRNVLEGIGGPFVSPDGRYLYGAANRAETVSAFALGAGGAIRFASCVTRRDDERPCRQGPRPEGVVHALAGPARVSGTADGRFLFVSSTYGTIVTLRRNRASGALTPASCISSNGEDRNRCATVPATAHRTKGTHHASLLTGARTPLLTGDTMLVPIRTIDGIAELARNPRTGALAFRACATGTLELSTARKGPCTPLPGATRKGSGSGFYKTTALLPAPGGLVYAAASGDATVSVIRP